MDATPNIAHYRVHKILGKGGMGTVYLASHAQIGLKVAIKELKPEFTRDRGIRYRFKNEASLMANLSHPNIVALHDYIETPEGVYLIMEYVDGITLDYYIHQISGPIPEAKAIDIFGQILKAVQYAHDRNIIHRDIKPANIMITQQGGIKMLDFGIAKHINPQQQGLTQTGVRLGTIFYMSPEQIRAQNTDARSDIYSLGMTLYEMLTATNPYMSDASEFDISQKIVHEPLPPARTFYPGISAYMQRILDKATAKSPQDRFQSAREFEQAILGNQEISLNNVPEHTVEWIISSKAQHQEEQQEVAEVPVDKEEIILVPQQETLLLKNRFGRISDQSLHYLKGRDLFEKGTLQEVGLGEIVAAELSTHQEIITGLFFILFPLPLLYFFWNWFTIGLASLLIGFGALCFTNFPTITIEKQDLKKLKMKGWPWEIRSASHYVHTLRDQIP